jgi:Kef-type K+ transport system membrane component KefB
MFYIFLPRLVRNIMYQTLTFYHSLFRWLVLISLLIAIYRGYKGVQNRSSFSKSDNLIRHWTATIAHIQLIIGITLYSQSPSIKYFWANKAEAIKNADATFFALIHILLMIAAIVVITIGSALAKRRNTDHAKFKTMLIWFVIALLIIIIAIPWPFSPLANRPYWR